MCNPFSCPKDRLPRYICELTFFRIYYKLFYQSWLHLADLITIYSCRKLIIATLKAASRKMLQIDGVFVLNIFNLHNFITNVNLRYPESRKKTEKRKTHIALGDLLKEMFGRVRRGTETET